MPLATTATALDLQWSGQLMEPEACAALFAGNEGDRRCDIAALPIRVCCDVSLAFFIHMKSLGVGDARCPLPGTTLIGQRAGLALGGAEAAVQVAERAEDAVRCAVRQSW